MPIGPARMPLMDHLGELRRRLTIIVVSLAITAVVLYNATPVLIDFIMNPIRAALPHGSKLTVLTVLGGFTIRFKVAVFFGAIVCSPIIIWEVMAFFLPALKKNERKWVIPTVAAMVVLFYLGMAFCYLIIQNAAVGWMIDQSRDFANIVANAEDYINIMMLLEIGKTFRAQWRYIYVGLMVLSAVVTPDASPVTMVLMFAALIGLYEVALAIARYVLVARDGKESLKWTREEYQEHKYEEEMSKL